MLTTKWLNRFLNLAFHVAEWSKDPSTKVGAVIIDDKNRIISVGYNGFPIGVNDDPSRYNDRPVKYSLVCHAERNALDNAPIQVQGARMFVTLPPCNECAKSIIQRGIKEVWWADIPQKLMTYDWETDVYNWKAAKLMFMEAGVETYGDYPPGCPE